MTDNAGTRRTRHRHPASSAAKAAPEANAGIGGFAGWLKIGMLLFMMVIFSHCFNYIYWRDSIAYKIQFLILGFIYLYGFVLHFFFSDRRKTDPNNWLIWCLILLPLVSGVFSVYLYGLPVSSLSYNLLISLGFLCYIFIKDLGITGKQIIVSLTIFGLVTFVIQVLQQVIIGIPLFGYEEENGIGERNNLMRFFIGSYFVALICIFYYWTRFIEKVSIISGVLLVIFLISLYLYLTRQMMLSVGVTILLSVFLIKDTKKRVISIILMCIGAYVLYSNFDTLFGEFIESYEEDSYTTDIRKEFIGFIINKFAENPILLVTGQGHPDFLLEWKYVGYYISDIGFVGEAFLYGVGWIILYFYTLYRFLFKYRAFVPLYVRLFYISTAIISIFIFPYPDAMSAFIWMLSIYLSTLDFQSRQSRKQSRKKSGASPITKTLPA